MTHKIGMKGLLLAALVSASLPTHAQSIQPMLTIRTAESGPVISRHIFGQFAEHLGRGIYGGVWVGHGSKIPNVRGIRTDVVKALRDLKVPNVRWPGGCFAEAYHWRDGIGPREGRPARLNRQWGGVIEDNSFGTHEFMDFIDQIGSEAYIIVNVGTGTPQEAVDWLEYMTTDKPTTLGKERVANGRTAPYRLKFVGLGNESWGCGGSMQPEAYVDRMAVFNKFLKNLHPNQYDPPYQNTGPDRMERIAVGPNGAETAYVEAVMKAWHDRKPYSWQLDGLSVHQYFPGRGFGQEPGAEFDEASYAAFLKQVYEMNDVIDKHSAIMDRYDPEKRIALVIDEWGSWLEPLPGSHKSFLEQNNSLRDGISAALVLNIFARHADRVRMANIAQMINVLQTMIRTDNERILLTPTYHVFRMYVPFQDADFIPINLHADEYKQGDITLPRLDVIAARARDGKLWAALVNLDARRPANTTISIPGIVAKSASGEVLTAARVDAVNSFERPQNVSPKPVHIEASQGNLVLRLPPKSLTVVMVDE